ncbi:hypothetical protein, partial [Stomatobaculum longum]|uniref:hypothetical protein n=1 Tax=Stomatobaculum longum TaxID=796942 RepID=UPI0028E2ECFB
EIARERLARLAEADNQVFIFSHHCTSLQMQNSKQELFLKSIIDSYSLRVKRKKKRKRKPKRPASSFSQRVSRRAL